MLQYQENHNGTRRYFANSDLANFQSIVSNKTQIIILNF